MDTSSPEAKGFFEESGGFACYGLSVLTSYTPSPFTVTVKSKHAEMTILVRRDIDDIVGVAASAHHCSLVHQRPKYSLNAFVATIAS